MTEEKKKGKSPKEIRFYFGPEATDEEIVAFVMSLVEEYKATQKEIAPGEDNYKINNPPGPAT